MCWRSFVLGSLFLPCVPQLRLRSAGLAVGTCTQHAILPVLCYSLFLLHMRCNLQSSYRRKGDELRRQPQSEGKAGQKTAVTLRNEIASALLSLILLEESSKNPTSQQQSHWAHLSPLFSFFSVFILRLPLSVAASFPLSFRHFG